MRSLAQRGTLALRASLNHIGLTLPLIWTSSGKSPDLGFQKGGTAEEWKVSRGSGHPGVSRRKHRWLSLDPWRGIPRRTGKPSHVFAIALAVALASGCGRGATLTLANGGTYSGRPISNDETHVLIQTRHGRYVVCKRDVSDADHAGNGALIAGVALIATGVAAFYAGSHERTVEGGPNGFLVELGMLVLLGGVVTATIGATQFGASTDATGLPASPQALHKPCAPAVRSVGP